MKKLWCFIAGHDWINLYTLNNADIFDGVWRSSWGEHKCARCGESETWNYDR